jgi:D-alanine-D-alanine ligase-like ATP-grasp enzyme
MRKDHPGVVLNLSSVYGWEKSNLVPAILEIAGLRYTGSGMLGLSLARNYTRLFPILMESGIRVPPFQIIESGDIDEYHVLQYPLRLYRDWKKDSILVRNENELVRNLNKLPDHEKVVLVQLMEGKRISLFIFDNLPFLTNPGKAYVEQAQNACRILEAKGLVRFDFIQAKQPILIGVEIAPDPMDESLLQKAALAGWDAGHFLQLLIEHAKNDSTDALQQPVH